MVSHRFLKALALTLLLGVGFGSVGTAVQAEGEPVQVPTPRPGDTAFYRIKDIIDDPDVILGPMRYDWLSLSWGLPTEIPSPSGSPQPVVPVRYHSMYSEGRPYEVQTIRDIYMTAEGPIAERRPFSASWDDYGGAQLPQTGTPADDIRFGEMPAGFADYAYLGYQGPLGLCGLLAPIHGSAEPPPTMAVPGYCLNDRVMGTASTTMYEQVRTTTWRDRPAMVYQPVDGPAYNLTYAHGVPFPVEVEITLAEQIYDPWEVGRHFRLELQGFSRDGEPYMLPERVAPLPPLPLVERLPEVHLDESSMDGQGLLLSTAFAAAMADTASPRMSEFMQREGAYLGGAWRANYIDSDGRRATTWTLIATTGDSYLVKVVEHAPVTILLGLEQTYETRVGEYEFDLGEMRFPPAQTLPDRIVSLPEAMARQQMFHPRNAEPDGWGFYHDCANEACNRARFVVRAGQNLFPHTSAGLETQARPAPYERNVFFAEDGYASHTFVYEATSGSDGILPPHQPESTPAPVQQASQAAWSPPTAQTVASAGLLALLGGALYYFWPIWKAGFVGLFSRIRRDEVLDNPLRQTIMALVEGEPGIHFQELVRRLEVGRGTLEHHIHILMQNGYVVETRTPGYTCYSVKGAVDHRVLQALPAMKSPAGRHILLAVLGEPGISGRRLAAQLGLASSTITYHTKRMAAAGLLSNGDGLRATELAQSVLDACT